jgi:hypothetical protein
VIGLTGFRQASSAQASPHTGEADRLILLIGSITTALFTIVTPLIILKWNSVNAANPVPCSNGEVPFVIKYYPGSYVDLVAKNSQCGLAPEICLSDFDENSIEKRVDDFYQTLYSLAQENKGNVRVLPAINFIDGKLRYFVIPHALVSDATSGHLLMGCAVENETENQTIFQVKSMFSDGK